FAAFKTHAQSAMAEKVTAVSGEAKNAFEAVQDAKDSIQEALLDLTLENQRIAFNLLQEQEAGSETLEGNVSAKLKALTKWELENGGPEAWEKIAQQCGARGAVDAEAVKKHCIGF